MDPNVFDLAIFCPEKNFFEGAVLQVVFSTPEGSIGIMSGHSAMFAAVSEGALEFLLDSGWKSADIGQGFCEINNNRAEFYLDTAEWVSEAEASIINETQERADRHLHHSKSRQEHLRSQASMNRAFSISKRKKSDSY